MKKFTLMVVMLACLFRVSAQEPKFVTTEQTNRNVLIEEFTGRTCPNCPDGHVYANRIVANNPGRVWSVNVHAGGYSPTNYPNLNTTPSTTIMNGFGVTGYPTGVVNRSKYEVLNRGEWESEAKKQMAQTAECNVAGQVILNKVTRTATITVEVYYTGNSSEDKNYLTVMMLQDSILGSQSGANYNPAQVVGNQYCHMHILRDVITPTWGEEILPTTAGTLITKQYVYNIPEVIGSPNGVDVDLNNIEFLAVITEKEQSNKSTRPILNVNELPIIEGADEPIYPFIKSLEQEDIITCTKEKKFTVNVANAGTEVITSMKLEISAAGNTTTQDWTGEIPVYGNVNIDMFAEVPFGGTLVNIKIVEANGQEYSFEKSLAATSEEWKQVELEDTQATETFKLELAQDRFGNQITWQVIGHDDRVIAKGGPYEMLSAAGTKVHEEYITVPAGECFIFVIEDNVGNGITSANFGQGYYNIYDSKGNKLVESDGNYGFGEYHIFYVHGGLVAVEDVKETSYSVYPNPVKDVLTVSGEGMKQVTVYNALGQLVKTVNCNDNTVQINVSDLRNGMYFVNVVNNNGEMSTSKVSVLK